MIDQILYNHMATVNHGFSSINKVLLYKAADVIVDAITNGKNIFTCGNGASAAIAQHWASRMMRYMHINLHALLIQGISLSRLARRVTHQT